jgi:hypothetical protein
MPPPRDILYVYWVSLIQIIYRQDKKRDKNQLKEKKKKKGNKENTGASDLIINRLR